MPLVPRHVFWQRPGASASHMPHWRAPWAPAISKPPAPSKPRRTRPAPRPEWDVRLTQGGCPSAVPLARPTFGFSTPLTRPRPRPWGPVTSQDTITNVKQYALTDEDVVRPHGAALFSLSWHRGSEDGRRFCALFRPVCPCGAPQERRRELYRSRNLIVISPPGAHTRGAAATGVTRASCHLAGF